MDRKKRNRPYRALAISLVSSAVLLVIGLSRVPELSGPLLVQRLLWPMTRLRGLITLGLLVGQAIEAAGWTRRLGALAGPLFRFSHLGPHCSAAFSTAFFSGVAANGMLLEFYQTGKISRQQLFLSNFINQVPNYFLHLPTTVFIVLPMTGRAGGIYFALTFTALMLRTLILAVYGRLRLPALEDSLAPERPTENTTGGRTGTIWDTVRRRLPKRILRIIVFVVPIYILVFLVNAAGGFDLARRWMAQFVVTSVLPVESISVVILGFAAEFTSGFAAAGALLEAGVLTVKETALALVIGNVVAFPIRALRHQLPHYMGIFSPRMGVQLLLMGQGLRVISLLLVGAVYYWIG